MERFHTNIRNTILLLLILCSTLLTAQGTRAGADTGPTWLFMIGIDRYSDGTAVPSAVHAVDTLQAFLSETFSIPADQQFILTNEQATAANIDRTLEQFKNRIRSGDQIIFFYSGLSEVRTRNAVSKIPYLIPYDPVPERIQANGISIPSFIERLLETPLGGMVLFLDAPFSGTTMFTDRMVEQDHPPYNNVLPSVTVLIPGWTESVRSARTKETRNMFVNSVIATADRSSDAVTSLDALVWCGLASQSIVRMTNRRFWPQQWVYPRSSKAGAQFQYTRQVWNIRTIVTGVRDGMVLDGERPIGRTPFTFRFKERQRTIKVTAPGFSSESVLIDAEQSPETVKVELRSTARLRVRTNPSGATVSIDSVTVGTTPLFLPKVDRSLHQLVIQAPYHTRIERPLDLTDSSEVELDLELLPLTGTVSLTGMQGAADVRIAAGTDIRRFDRVPAASHQLHQGSVTILVEKPGYWSFDSTVTLDADQLQVPVRMGMKPPAVAIGLSVILPGSGQWFQGRRFIGVTLMGGFLASAYAAQSIRDRYNNESSIYTVQRNAYRSALDPEVISGHFERMNTAYKAMQRYRTQFYIASGIAFSLSAFSIIDASLFTAEPWEETPVLGAAPVQGIRVEVPW